MGPSTEGEGGALCFPGKGDWQQLRSRVASPTLGATGMTQLSVTSSTHNPVILVPSPGESVDIIVRLRDTPKSPLSGAPLDFTVEDVTLQTTQTPLCAPSSSNGLVPLRPQVLPTPRDDGSPSYSHSLPSTSFGGGECEPASRTTKASTTPALSGTHSSAPVSVPVPAMTPLRMDVYSLQTSPFVTEPPATHPREDLTAGAGSGYGDAALPNRSIGSRGRLLTITSPSTEERLCYEFGEILGPDATDEALCARLIPSIMEQLVAGFSVCVLCYDPSCSGKTYTISALAPAVADEIFRAIDVDKDIVEVSSIHIFDDKAYNILGGAHSDELGTELSRLTVYGNDRGGRGCLGRASEPKATIRSTAEMMERINTTLQLQMMNTDTLSARDPRSFILFSLHITCFLDGVPITTTRVTLVDLAGTGGLKKSDTTGGESSDQTPFFERSLMALRQRVGSDGTDAEMPQPQDSLLMTYLEPCLRSWHLILLLNVSLDAGSFEETKLSLEFGTSARHRRITKSKSYVEEHLSGSLLRALELTRDTSATSTIGGADRKGDAASLEGDTAISEPYGVVGALQHRIEVLEEALSIELKRSVISETGLPATGIPPNTDSAATTAVVDVQATSLADAEALQHELRYYRRLLQEREEQLGRLRKPASLSIAEGRPSKAVLPNSFGTSSMALGGGGAVTDVDQQELTTAGPPMESSDGCDRQVQSGEDDGCDAHAGLLQCVRQLLVLHSCVSNAKDLRYGDVLDSLHNVALRATEQYDEMCEQLIFVSRSLNGLRAQYRRLVGEVLHVNKRLLATDEVLRDRCASLEAVKLQATTSERERENLRLQLFQAYADQSVREDMTRLYLDAKLIAASADETVAGDRQTEQQVELDKVQAHQQVLCGKITELVNNVEQLTRSVAQRDLSLAALESVITPAQRALFHTFSNTIIANGERGAGRPSGSDGRLSHSTSVAIPGEDGSTAADCYTLLQSCVSELRSLLTQEQQQHQFTQCELLEAREDARRSRQEQRQALFQQREEERRVSELTRENHELRQQNGRHQLYLDQMYTHFHEQLQQLRLRHEEELTELRSIVGEAPQQQDNSVEAIKEGYSRGDEYDDHAASAVATPADTLRNTLQRVSSSRDRTPESTMRGFCCVGLVAANGMGSGDANRLSSTRRHRCGRVRRPSAKAASHRLEEKEARCGLATYSAVDAANTARSQRIGRSSKVPRRSSSLTKSKLQLFATYGGAADPSGASAPLSASDVVASARPAARRRIQTPKSIPHAKRRK